MTFIELLTDARTNSASQQQIIDMYKPLLIKESITEGVFDEDLYQELDSGFAPVHSYFYNLNFCSANACSCILAGSTL